MNNNEMNNKNNENWGDMIPNYWVNSGPMGPYKFSPQYPLFLNKQMA